MKRQASRKSKKAEEEEPKKKEKVLDEIEMFLAQTKDLTSEKPPTSESNPEK